MNRIQFLIVVAFCALLAAGSDVRAEVGSAASLVRKSMPQEDPGPPFYARLAQPTLEGDGWVAIPFYRSPVCVPPSFNLLSFYDFPGPGGPGAFDCALIPTGFLLIEPDAPLGTFPHQAVFEGKGVPVWFVRSSDFRRASEDGLLTIGELESLRPRRGAATEFTETLLAREHDHKLLITASGLLQDGEFFTLTVAAVDNQYTEVDIAFDGCATSTRNCRACVARDLRIRQ